MGIFKTIGAAYKALKATKEVCCNVLEKSQVELQVSSEEHLKKRTIDMEKKYEQFFENSENHMDIDSEFRFYTGEISKDEYEKNEINFQEKLKQARLDVESGKISHEDFYNIVRNKR